VTSSRERHRATLQARCRAVEALTARTNKLAVLVVQQFPVGTDEELLCPPVRESIANILMFVELGTVADFEWILQDAMACCGVVALDCDQKLPGSAALVDRARALVAADRLMLYSDNAAWFDSAIDMIGRIHQGVTGRGVVLCGTGALADQAAFSLPRLGAKLVTPADVTPASEVAIVIGAAQKAPSIDADLVARLPDGAAIHDIGIGNLTAEAATLARARQLPLYRLDNRAGISSAIVRLLETDYMVTKLMGHVHVRGVDIVAGGLLAPPGAVIVDDIRSPAHVLGVADGQGRFRLTPLSAEDQARLDFVTSLTVGAFTKRGSAVP
jgi:hypothetical protein